MGKGKKWLDDFTKTACNVKRLVDISESEAELPRMLAAGWLVHRYP